MNLTSSPVFDFLRSFETPEVLIGRAGHYVWPIVMRARTGKFTAFTQASAESVETWLRPKWFRAVLRFLSLLASPFVRIWAALRPAAGRPVKLSADPADEVAAELTAAIALATGRQVDSVKLLNPIRRRDADVVGKTTVFDDRVFRYDHAAPFGSSLCVALWEYYWQTLRAQLADAVGFDKVGSFEDQLKAILRREIGEPLKLQFYDGQTYVPTSPAGESLLATLYYYLAFTVVGDLEEMRRLEPLVRCLGRAIPLAALADYPGQWVAAKVPERAA